MPNFTDSLNETGRKNWRIMIKLQLFGVAVTAALLLVAYVTRFGFHWGFALPLAFGGIHYIALLNKIQRKSKKEALESLGFTKTSFNGMMGIYDIAGRGKFAGSECYQGSLDGQAFKLVGFNNTVGSGKNKHTYHFMGVEFKTEKTHFPVQVYDKHNELKPWLRAKRTLESNDFHKYFTVFSEDPSHSFYQLDPDSMSELIDLRKEYGHGVNIESRDNKILIYVRQAVLDKELSNVITFADALNEEISDEKKRTYRGKIHHFMSRLIKLFKALDYELTEKSEGKNISNG